ncbi:unnamed protein product [Aureobasidium vineae]|uniref:Uncharacterized protein n=1 Tax=Aureobasidium vineae TaxID=2773715 RepID=A0A9N8JFA7_9PEZI|nr:unnamed protein product [Aureobasidium vineae]
MIGRAATTHLPNSRDVPIDLTEDSDESMEVAEDLVAATNLPVDASSLVADAASREATAKFYDMSIEELNMALDAAHEISKDIPVALIDSTRRSPPPTVLQQPLKDITISRRPDGLNLYIDALQDKTSASLTRLMAEKHKEGTKQQIPSDALRSSFTEILFRTHTQVLAGVLEVLDFLAREPAAKRKRPGIYCNVIGHTDTGEFLTLGECNQVVAMMRQYINYTDKPDKSKLRYATTGRALTQIRKFLNAFDARIKNIALSHDQSLPLPGSIHEFGFGADIENRLQSHQQHHFESPFWDGFRVLVSGQDMHSGVHENYPPHLPAYAEAMEELKRAAEENAREKKTNKKHKKHKTPRKKNPRDTDSDEE